MRTKKDKAYLFDLGKFKKPCFGVPEMLLCPICLIISATPPSSQQLLLELDQVILGIIRRVSTTAATTVGSRHHTC